MDEKVSKYASYIFEPLDTSLWSVTHEEDDMKVVHASMMRAVASVLCLRSIDESLRRTMWWWTP